MSTVKSEACDMMFLVLRATVNPVITFAIATNPILSPVEGEEGSVAVIVLPEIMYRLFAIALKLDD
jgi:hypothetical protein